MKGRQTAFEQANGPRQLRFLALGVLTIADFLVGVALHGVEVEHGAVAGQQRINGANGSAASAAPAEGARHWLGRP
jgi:hypothetical protein